MLKRQKDCSCYMVKKLLFQKWVLVVSVVEGLVITLSDVRNVKSRFTNVVQMCLGEPAYFQVSRFLSLGCVWIITSQ